MDENLSPPPPPAAPEPPSAASSVRRRHPLVVALLGLAALVALVVIAATSMASWLLYSESGAVAVLARTPGAQVSGVHGSLLGGNLLADRIEVPLSDGRTLVIEQVQVVGLAPLYEASAPWNVGIEADRASAQRIYFRGTATLSKNAEPASPPQRLVLPLSVRVDRVAVAELWPGQAGSGEPVRDLSLALALGSGFGATHRIDKLSARWDGLSATGSAQIGASAPLPLRAAVSLRPDAAAPADPRLPADWSAEFSASGPLAELSLSGQVRAKEQSLDLKAQVLPFALQPVHELDASARRFDLAALLRGAPRTALTGNVRAALLPAATTPAPGDTSKAPEPVQVQVDLRNEAPGRSDEGALPIRALRLEARSDVRNPRSGALPSLLVELGTSTTSAGRIGGKGTWNLRGDGPTRQVAASFDGQLTDLRPALADRSAPGVRLTGPLAIRYEQALPQGSAPGEPRFEASADLRGRLESRPGSPEASVNLALKGTPSVVEVQRLHAQAGAARADFSGRVGHSAGRWNAAGDLALNAFDPTVWVPLAPDSPWRRSRQQVTGTVKFELDGPRPASGDAMRMLAALRGRVDAVLREGVVADVPVSGTAELRAPGNAPLSLRARLRGAQVDASVDGSVDATGNGAGDRWALRWQAPSVDALMPLVRLAGGPALSGDSAGQLDSTGRWPAMRASGQATSERLRIGDTTATKLALRVVAGTAPQDPLEVDATADRIALEGNERHVESPSLSIRGTQAEHRLSFRAQAPLSSTAADASPDALPVRRAAARADLSGGFRRDGPNLSWSGRIDLLEIRDALDPKAAAWLRLAGAPLQAAHGQQATSASLGATRVQVADAVLRIDEAHWQRRNAAPGGGIDTALKAELEPLAVAPLLARSQPTFGWGGDLRVGGHIDLRADANGMDAEFTFGRLDGDLFVYDPVNPKGVEPLGLTDAHVAFQARHGLWHAEERVAGGNLGTISGTQTLRAPAAALYPPVDAPIEGQLDVQVANLGAWGLLVPAGWRLSGALSTQLRVAGRMNAPQFTGELVGQRIGVQSPLQGVDVRDLQLRVNLAGTSARIESFVAHAGQGTLTATGDARLGESPRLQIDARADHFAVLQRIDRRAVVSGDARVVLDPRSTTVTGNILVDEGLIDITQSDAPSLDEDVDVRRPGQRADDDAGSAKARAARRTLTLDLHLNAGEHLRLRGRGLDALLRGELRLTTPSNRLAVNGTIRAEEGTYAAYGQKLQIDRGVIAFNGPAENPRLDIEAVRPSAPGSTGTTSVSGAPGEDVRVGVAITGTAQSPRVRLFSEPDMSETDKLSWLIMGRPSDGLGRTDLALLQRAAYALLAGESESQSLVERVGLDELSVRQNDTGTVRETVVTLGKQLSRHWYVGYERSLNAAAGTWQLIYRIAQRYTLRAQSGTENSLDLIWSWRWR